MKPRSLAKKLNITEQNYQDLVADISLSVPDDLCIIECKGDQRLLAASICSPSYWNIKSKIGKSLKAIHKPVNSLNEKIGNPIEKFINNAPIDTPFLRENWFVHGDDQRMHLKPEDFPAGPVDSWIVSLKEKLCINLMSPTHYLQLTFVFKGCQIFFNLMLQRGFATKP